MGCGSSYTRENLEATYSVHPEGMHRSSKSRVSPGEVMPLSTGSVKKLKHQTCVGGEEFVSA